MGLRSKAPRSKQPLSLSAAITSIPKNLVSCFWSGKDPAQDDCTPPGESCLVCPRHTCWPIQITAASHLRSIRPSLLASHRRKTVVTLPLSPASVTHTQSERLRCSLPLWFMPAASFTVCLYFMSAAVMLQEGPMCLISGASLSHLWSLKSDFLWVQGLRGRLCQCSKYDLFFSVPIHSILNFLKRHLTKI